MEELPKMGRNEQKFNHEFEVHIGARLYDTAESTEYRELGTLVDNIDQGEPTEYVVEEEEEVPDSAASLFSTMVAAFMVIVALNFWAMIRNI